MVESADLDELDHDELLLAHRRLKYRTGAMVFFLKEMGIWEDYLRWLKVKSSRIDG